MAGEFGADKKFKIGYEANFLNGNERIVKSGAKEHGVSELIKPSRKTEARVERNSTIYHAVEPGVEKGEVDMNEGSGRSNKLAEREERQNGRIGENGDLFANFCRRSSIFHARDGEARVSKRVSKRAV